MHSTVSGLIETGNAYLINRRTGQAIENRQVRYYGKRCGPMCGLGRITVQSPGLDKPVMTINWRIS